MLGHLSTRTLAALPATLLLASALAPPGASAVGETCRGEAATIVSAPGALSTDGTEGRDVIVSTGGSVNGEGGDDLICVVGQPDGRDNFVNAGAGNDVVDASRGIGRTTVHLGAGRDVFVDGSSIESVSGDGDGPDAEHDVFDMGDPPVGTDERDSVASGAPALPNDDTIVTRGGAADVVVQGVMADFFSVSGSPDSTLEYRVPFFTSSRIDVAHGAWVLDARPVLHFTDFWQFTLRAAAGAQSVSFDGTAADESILVESPYEGSVTANSTLDLDLRMRGGNDGVGVNYFNLGHDGDPITPTSLVQGGGGIDAISLVLPRAGQVDVDLGRGRLTTRRDTVETTTNLRGFEDAFVLSPEVRIAGTNGRNDLTVDACRTVAKGLSGADTITARVTTILDVEVFEYLGCGQGERPTLKVVFRGGKGSDLMTGAYGDDRLFGGPGRDTAIGKKGRDRCSAEKTLSCEVQPRR